MELAKLFEIEIYILCVGGPVDCIVMLAGQRAIWFGILFAKGSGDGSRLCLAEKIVVLSSSK